MRIFGLTGKMRSGKDTFFAAVRDEAPAVVRLAFGDELKAEVAAACGVSLDYINVNKAAFRVMLQWWGTDFRRRQFGEDYWLRKIGARVDALAADAVVFITDCRFANEAALVRARGGRMIRTVRLNVDGLTTDQQAAHASETEQDGIAVDDELAADSKAELQCLAARWARKNLCR